LENIPNGRKIHQYCQFRGPPKYTQMGIFGLKNLPSGNPGAQPSQVTVDGNLQLEMLP
jgi:hypothetical protein